uniref:ADP-dependent glucokinase n=1 Tax=Aceria tosichella TaxID=561515 RepID=A0A6G1SKR1_9ACAR
MAVTKKKKTPELNEKLVKDEPQARFYPSSSARTKQAIFIVVVAAITAIVRWKFMSQIGLINTNTNGHIDETLKSMLSIESRVKINKDLNVAVGFGSCLDIFVSSRELILDKHQPPVNQVHHENIRTQDQLNEVLAYFFNEGAAAERYIDNRTFFMELVGLAESADGSRKAIGGNAATMAKRFVLEGVDRVMLGTQLSKRNSDRYNDKLVISGPIVDHDDVHICIEYPAGEKWGTYVAPRANRLIIHSDYYNPALKSVDNFITRLESAKNLDLLVIGGLQMMDNIPIAIEERREKLLRLSRVLERLPPGRPKVHMELASFTEEALLGAIRDLIIPHVDSLGMNEQELPMLLSYLNEGDVNTRSESYPRVATILDQMRQLYKQLYRPTRGRLSRMHAHTLAFQAIMTRVGSDWRNSLTSSVKAALTAHRYTCGSDEIDMAKAKLIMDESYTTSKEGSRRRIPFNPKHPVVCWQEDILVDDSSHPTSATAKKTETIEICVAPVLVCTKVRQTGGAGDNVSAAGLIFQF